MIGLIDRLSMKVGGMSHAARHAWLNGCLAVVTVASLAYAMVQDEAAAAAVLIAAVVCGLSANAALFAAAIWHGTPRGVAGALAGSLLGMFPPLVVGTMLQMRGGAAAEAGVFGWIVVFYLSALVVKTLLIAPAPRRSVAAGSTAATEAGA